MTDPESPDELMFSTAFDRLQKLTTDQYIIAFGPNGRQFFATPNGYAAVQLPMAVLGHISSMPVRKITWGSFGSHVDCWFFAYELFDGTSTFRVGTRIPPTLQQFIDKIRPVGDLCTSLRVQFGNKDSFVAWTTTSWACHGIPAAVEAKLCQLSDAHMRSTAVTRGVLKGALSQVAWHHDGSYFIEAQQGYFWHFESRVTRSAWGKLWLGRIVAPSLAELSELVLVAIDPHAPVAESFAFIKKQHGAPEAPFVMHIYQDSIHAAEALDPTPAAQPGQDTRIQHVEQEPEKPRVFRWAVSTQTGRPHPNDTWELVLKRGQKVKVWEDLGRGWYNVERPDGVKGWVHGTWLTFCGSRVHRDARSTYTHFEEDMRKLLVPGQLREFPALREYTSDCAEAACQPLKTNTQVGVCVHDLQVLLEGSGQYSYGWLKEERIVWHPDKFARFCHAQHKDRLKTSAQELFVLYGVLMDMCGEK